MSFESLKYTHAIRVTHPSKEPTLGQHRIVPISPVTAGAWLALPWLKLEFLYYQLNVFVCQSIRSNSHKTIQCTLVVDGELCVTKWSQSIGIPREQCPYGNETLVAVSFNLWRSEPMVLVTVRVDSFLFSQSGHWWWLLTLANHENRNKT